MNADVLAHFLFVPVGFLAAYLAWKESKSKKPKELAEFWIALGFLAGAVYFSFLWFAGVKITEFSSLNTISKQHLLISLSLIITSVIGQIILKLKNDSWKFVRIFIVVELGIIFWIHNHSHHHDAASTVVTADWLQPFHRVIAGLLFTAGIALLLEYFYKKKWLLKVAAVSFAVIAILLMFYHNPYHVGASTSNSDSHSHAHSVESDACPDNGNTIKVSISQKAFVPNNISAKRCDKIEFNSTDQKVHIVAFGEHEHHSHYGDNNDLPVVKNKPSMLVLRQPGEFHIHDHNNDEVTAVLNVAQ